VALESESGLFKEDGKIADGQIDGMAFYRFQIRSQLTTQAVLERVKALAREAPKSKQWLAEALGWRPEGSPPFIGKLEGNSFMLYRDIQYINSFLPQIKGTVDSCVNGTRIHIFMYLHPFVLVFILTWLAATGLSACVALSRGDTGSSVLVPLGLFIFGLVLSLAGFYPEAMKARRLFEQHIGKTNA
jgi:hypothetical protein